MNNWLILATWCAGWLLAIRPSMRRTMLQKVCDNCSGSWGCECSGRVRLVIRGSKFERTGGDVAWSMWIAAWWPVWLAIVVLRKTFTVLGAGVTRAVIKATPLTSPELERRLVQQQAEIDRLTKQIGKASPP